jgi:hypothetical protein
MLWGQSLTLTPQHNRSLLTIDSDPLVNILFLFTNQSVKLGSKTSYQLLKKNTVQTSF